MKHERLPLPASLVAIALVLGLVSIQAASQADAKPQEQRPAGAAEQAQPGSHDEAFSKCSQACVDCQRVCDACSAHCAHAVANGKKEHLSTLRTCQDCADVCAAAARITARHGPLAEEICTACAEACAECGKACEQHGHDPMMKACADECRACEKACRDMVKHVSQKAANK